MEMERGPSLSGIPLPSLVEKQKNVKTAPGAKEIRTSPSVQPINESAETKKILTAPAKRLGDAATLVGEINVPIGLERRVSPRGEESPNKVG